METFAKCDKGHDKNSECVFSMATSVFILLTILGVGKEMDRREGTFLASSLREILKQMSVC